MTNIETIMFKAKYKIYFKNDFYYVFGFMEETPVKISNRKIKTFFESGIEYFNKKDWNDFKTEKNLL